MYGRNKVWVPSVHLHSHGAICPPQPGSSPASAQNSKGLDRAPHSGFSGLHNSQLSEEMGFVIAQQRQLTSFPQLILLLPPSISPHGCCLSTHYKNRLPSFYSFPYSGAGRSVCIQKHICLFKNMYLLSVHTAL